MSSDLPEEATGGNTCPDLNPLPEAFVDSIKLPEDFDVDDDGKLLSIRGVPVGRLTMKVLRKVCIRFRVSGYKNQTKAVTLTLIARILMRDALFRKIYEEDLPPVEQENCAVNDVENEDCDEADNDKEATDEGNNSFASSGISMVDNGKRPTPGVPVIPTPTSTNKYDEAPRSASKNKKLAKSTPPKAIQSMSSYFRIINVYMCEKNRNLVMRLGQAPTMAELDARKMRSHAVFLQLNKQYLDDEDEDANTMAFSDHEFWSYVGIDSNICQNYDLLTEQDFSDALSYINFHYQASYRKNKQSGNHDDFVNFVGSRHFLFYYHLWLSECPHLLNFAVPLLPSGAQRQTTGSSDSSSANQSRLLRKQRDSVSASASSMQQHQEIAKVLASLEKTNSERIKILKESAAPRRERELLNVYYEYKERMKTAKKELAEAESEYDSDSSDVKNARMELALCKRKRDEAFSLLSNTELRK